MKKYVIWVYLLISIPGFSWADEFESQLNALQQSWDETNFLASPDAKEKKFERLADQARSLAKQYPDQATAWIWQGIVLSTYAGESGGLSALGLVKEAKQALERALSLDPKAMQGAAYVSLGALYYQVPGWPISFGDDDVAQELLLKALEIDAIDIENNYFYADYLMNQNKMQEAMVYYNKVLSAPMRANRIIADQARKETVERILNEREKN